MSNMWEGKLTAQGMHIGIVAARFNAFITEKLVTGAEDALRRHGVDPNQIDIAWVPGAFEIPLIADQLAGSGRYDAVITLGAVIRGATPHFDYVCSEAAKGIAATNLKYSVPVIFGLLTVDTIEQAVERAGTKAGNKGWDAAVAGIEMANLQQMLKQELQK